MLEGMEHLFDDMESMMKKLKKKTFEKNTVEFEKKYRATFQGMTSLVEAAEGKADAVKKVAEQLTDTVKVKFASKRGRIGSGTQADLNLFMIFYVFPTLLKTEHEDARMIADGICSEWAVQFKGNNIQYTDYDSIYATFREKIFGIL